MSKNHSCLRLTGFCLAILTIFITLNPAAEIQNSIPLTALPRQPVPAEVPDHMQIDTAKTSQPVSLGFDEVRSASPGMQIGITTYDNQSNNRMNRQVDWRATQMVHFAWTKQLDRIAWGNRRTSYEAWNPATGGLLFGGEGQCVVSSMTYSGFVGLDVDTEGKVVIADHSALDEHGSEMVATVWYDFCPGCCFFPFYHSRLPDSLRTYYYDPEGDYLYQWPSMEYQVWDGDTVTHVFAQQYNGWEPGFIVYFRRYGSDTAGSWDYPPVVIDTIGSGISQTVTASRVSGRVALVWSADLPAIPGGSESVERGRQDDNDIYCVLSDDLGATWGGKHNITKSDSSQAGWRAGSDLSCLIDSDDRLHIIWSAREYSPLNGGTFPHYYGSRLFHWSDLDSAVRVIKDANWNLPFGACHGGSHNDMSIVKMQLSECDGKFYALFVQFNDIYNGISDDCHQSNWSAGRHNGTANGELYIAVSDNGGHNWDIARNLTNTYTPHCDTIGAVICESDMWPSMSRFGMDASGGNFTGVPIIDPSGGYSGSMYLDVLYVNDKFPGSCVLDYGVWYTNPVKWFRVPCVEPVPCPILAYSPEEIAFPAWVKPGYELDTLLRLENIGNEPIIFDSIRAVRITGLTYDWLGISGEPASIPETGSTSCDMHVLLNKGGTVTGGPYAFDGIIVFAGNFIGSPDTLSIHIVVADTLQFPEWASIRTQCKRISLSNAGNMGNAGRTPGYNLDFFDDCDVTDNDIGRDNNARIYLRDASPFLLRVKGNDTVLNAYVFDADWTESNGFLPTEGLTLDSSHADYQYLSTGKILAKDSLTALECDYWAPLHPDSCDFIVQRLKIYNNGGGTTNGVFIGEIMDWDIPSDDMVENGSGDDISRKMMYCYGAEYQPDTICNDNCVLSDSRYGAYAYYDGYRMPFDDPGDSLRTLRGVFTGLYSDWVAPTGRIVPSQLYEKLTELTTYQAWQSTHPEMEDSLYQNLIMVSAIGQYNIAATDTLTFVNIFATEYDGGLSRLQITIEKARSWIGSRPDIFSWPGPTACCNKPGDANNNGTVNILDVTYTINYLYKGGPAPPCLYEADANGDCLVDVLDCIRLVKYVFCGGAAPICPADCL
jgi:hypothetical protein